MQVMPNYLGGVGIASPVCGFIAIEIIGLNMWASVDWDPIRSLKMLPFLALDPPPAKYGLSIFPPLEEGGWWLMAGFFLTASILLWWVRMPILPARETGPQAGNGLVLCATCHHSAPTSLNGADLVRDYPALRGTDTGAGLPSPRGRRFAAPCRRSTCRHPQASKRNRRPRAARASVRRRSGTAQSRSPASSCWLAHAPHHALYDHHSRCDPALWDHPASDARHPARRGGRALDVRPSRPPRRYRATPQRGSARQLSEALAPCETVRFASPDRCCAAYRMRR